MKQRALGALGLALSAGSFSAVAQIPVEPSSDPSPAPAPAPPSSASRLIEEVIVTAQKREENLQDVPISVQAFSAEVLDARGVSSALDLPLVTPGLTYNSLASYSIIYLRGVGTDAFIPSADLSIATYVDGVYFPSSFGIVQDFGGLERLEVLKGPQGTLFGRNSTGGAISIITKKPDQVFENSVELTYGSYDQAKARAYSNIPLTETLAMNVAAVYSTADSYYKSETLDLLNDVNRAGRLKVRWTPADDFEITLAGMVVRSQGSGSLIATNPSPKPLLAPFALPPFNVRPENGYTVETDSLPATASDTRVVYTEVLWKPSWFDVKFIGSDQYLNTFGRIDFDSTNVPLAVFEGQVGSADIQTAELQFLSNDTSWGADWLTSILGLYYIKSTAGFDPVFLNVSATDELLTPIVDFLEPLPGVEIPSAARLKITGILDTQSTAAFFQSTAKVTDWFSVTLGGRYQTEKRDLVRANVGLDVDGTPPFLNFPSESAKTSNFSPKISLDFRPFEHTLAYLSYTQGFKSGTYNIINLYTAPDYVKPEKVTAYELGLKTEVLDGNLRFNAALFQTEIDQLQVQIVSLQSGGAVSFENAGSAKIRGGEFDTLWVPLPNVLPGLVATASATYLDSKYTDFDNGSGYDEVTGIYFGDSSVLPGRDFAGNQIARAPEFSAAGSLSYTFELHSGSVEVAGDYYYNSGYFFSAQNSSRSEQKQYDVVNARISYYHEPWRTRLTAFGRNVTNTKYYLYQFESDFGTASMLQSPAVYGLRLNWEF